MSPNRENFCVIYPIFGFSCRESPGTPKPRTVADPSVGVSRPHSIRIVVDFPEPLGPRNPYILAARHVQVEVADGTQVAEVLRQAAGLDREFGIRVHQST